MIDWNLVQSFGAMILMAIIAAYFLNRSFG